MKGCETDGGAQGRMAEPRLERVEQVSEGWIKKYLLHYTLPDGRPYTYEAVSRKPLERYEASLRDNASPPAHKQDPDAVCIVPRTSDNRLVAIKEFRYAINNWCIQLPAGLIDSGESMEAAVERELKEETGYALARDENGEAHVRALEQPGYSSAGMSEESVQIVYVHVEDEPSAGQQPEPNEFIEVFTVPVPEIPQFLASNELPMGTRAQLVFEAFSRNIKRYGV